MEMKAVKIPKQKRAIEKRKKIVNEAYALIAEKGYYHTTISEVAKNSGVSVAVVYNYFNDKNDLLMSVMQAYIDKMYAPLFRVLNMLLAPIDVPLLVDYILDIAIASHKEHVSMHCVVTALCEVDEKVNEYFITLQEEIVKSFVEKFKELNFNCENPLEVVHFAFNLIEDFSHDLIYHHHKQINYEVTKKLVRNCIVDMVLKKGEIC